MSVYVRNLVIDTNDDFSEIFELEQSGGLPVNLTGFAASCYMRKSPETSSYVGFGVSFLDRANGKIQISMASTVTSTVKPGRYVYDVLLIRPNGNRAIGVEGNVLVRSGISTGCF
jgi:hypothetical protein